MENTHTSLATLQHAGQSYAFIDLPVQFGARYQQLPVVLRLLLENAARHMVGTERDAAINALFDWLDTGTSEAEIAFQPGRVLMHDTTSTPALVDIAAMRNALAEAGVDPTVLNPGLQVDVSVDHSLAVEAYAKPNAASENLQHEIRRNAERYKFLRWASKVLKGVRINPPGTGIMHTINLEQLATNVRDPAVDVILLDTTFWGGIRPCIKAAGVCETFQLGIAVHSSGELGIQLATMLHMGAVLPNLAFKADAHYHHLADDIIEGGLMPYVKGAIAVPTAPGLGVKLDRDRVAHYAEEFKRLGGYPYDRDPDRDDWYALVPNENWADPAKPASAGASRPS